jgi:hypothetical protein
MRLAAAALVLCSSTAAASWRVHDDGYLDKPHVDLAIGVRVGSFLVNGDGSGFAIAGHVDGGVRLGRWLVYGEYGLYDASEPPPEEGAITPRDIPRPPRDGIMHRFGANVRFAVLHMSDYDDALDLFVEGGLGVQHFRWDAGGVWTRRDLALGVGVSFMSAENGRHLGATLGARVLLSGRNDVTGDEPVFCGGPCDHATGPTTVDRSIMFDLTFHFGT